jgi:holliday junction DNA helicase RuvB
MRDALRPTSLDDFVGQKEAVGHLRIVLRAARERGELCDHLLLVGPPGVGKTTLTAIIAAELGVPLVSTSGPAIERPADVASLLSGLTQTCVIGLDEIHACGGARVEEVLYPAMEDGVLDLIVGEGPKARSVRLPLPPFCLVAATTQAGMLSSPLRDRFGFVVRLGLYADDELAAVVTRSAGLLGCDVDDGAAHVVAGRSRGTPRIANALLRRVRDWAQLQGVTRIDAAAAQTALDAFGVDDAGLDQLGRELLRMLCTIFGGGPVGLSTLAAAVNEAPQTVAEMYEPHLMRCGLLARTQRGRVATPAAYSHLGMAVPAGAWAAAAASAQEPVDQPAA